MPPISSGCRTIQARYFAITVARMLAPDLERVPPAAIRSSLRSRPPESIAIAPYRRQKPYCGKYRPDAPVGPIGTTSFCWAIKHGYFDASDRFK